MRRTCKGNRRRPFSNRYEPPAAVDRSNEATWFARVPDGNVPISVPTTHANDRRAVRVDASRQATGTCGTDRRRAHLSAQASADSRRPAGCSHRRTVGSLNTAPDEQPESGVMPEFATADRTIVEMRDHVRRDAIAVGRWVAGVDRRCTALRVDMNADVPDVRSRQPPFMLDTARRWRRHLRIVCSPRGCPPRLEETRPHPWFSPRYAPLYASAKMFLCQLAETERSLAQTGTSLPLEQPEA